MNRTPRARRRLIRPFFAQVEAMEIRCLLSDFTMLAVTQTSGTTVTFDYQVQAANISSQDVDF